MRRDSNAENLRLVAMGLSIASVILVLVNAALALTNQTAAGAVAQRRDFINQTPQVARALQVVATTLAAQAGSDEPIKTLLTQNGITMTPTAQPK